AGVLAAAVVEKLGSFNQARMREQFSALQTTTLFGAFGIDSESGRQVAHQMLTVQWHKGRKMPIQPHPLSDRGSTEYSIGARFIAAGAELLGLGHRGKRDRDGGCELDGS